MTISSWLNFGHRERGWWKNFGSALLQPAHSVCVSSERFFIIIICYVVFIAFNINHFQHFAIKKPVLCWCAVKQLLTYSLSGSMVNLMSSMLLCAVHNVCSLHLTSMCLQYAPTVVACVCIHLACKWSSFEVHILYGCILFRSTSKSRPNNIREGEKCPSVRPSVRPQKVSSIWMKFGM